MVSKVNGDGVDCVEEGAVMWNDRCILPEHDVPWPDWPSFLSPFPVNAYLPVCMAKNRAPPIRFALASLVAALLISGVS